MDWLQQMTTIALLALIPGFIAARKNRSFWGYYLLSFLLSPIFSLIVILCLKRLNEDGTVFEPNTASSKEANVAGEEEAEHAVRSLPEEANVIIPRKIQYCRRCGKKLIEGSAFCSRCGTKII